MELWKNATKETHYSTWNTLHGDEKFNLINLRSLQVRKDGAVPRPLPHATAVVKHGEGLVWRQRKVRHILSLTIWATAHCRWTAQVVSMFALQQECQRFNSLVLESEWVNVTQCAPTNTIKIYIWLQHPHPSLPMWLNYFIKLNPIVCSSSSSYINHRPVTSADRPFVCIWMKFNSIWFGDLWQKIKLYSLSLSLSVFPLTRCYRNACSVKLKPVHFWLWNKCMLLMSLDLVKRCEIKTHLYSHFPFMLELTTAYYCLGNRNLFSGNVTQETGDEVFTVILTSY